MADISFNRARFLQVCHDICSEGHPRFNIGTYKEKKLHLILKNYFEPLTACQEVPHGGYVADIRNGEGIMEIQTSGFASMNGKLEAFLPVSAVTVIYPIAERKWVTWIDPESGDIQPRHRSPKKGVPAHVLPEMVFVRDYLENPNLTIRVVLLEIEEYRMLDGKRSRSRKRGSTRYERIPLDIYRVYDFSCVEDYIRVLPFEAGSHFTSAELSRKCGFRGRRLSAAIRVLETVGAIVKDGKQGRAYLYRVCDMCEDTHCKTEENGV